MTECYYSMITRIIFLQTKMKKQNNFTNIIMHPKSTHVKREIVFKIVKILISYLI